MKDYRYQNCHCHTNSLEVCAKFVNPTSNCSGAKYIEPCKLGSITFLCIPNVVNRPFCEEKPKHPSYIPTTHRMPCLFPRLPASIIPCTSSPVILSKHLQLPSSCNRLRVCVSGHFIANGFHS